MRRTGKKVISLLLTLSMLLSLCVIPAAATEQTAAAATIYVDAVNGNNDNAGTSEDAPKKTVKGAYAALAAVAETAGVTNDANAVIDIIVDGTDITSFKGNNTTTGFSGSHVYTVRITGKEPTDGILFGSNFNIPGPTVFDDITLDAANTAVAYFNANSYDLTITEDVTITRSGTYNFNLVSGKNASGGFTAERDAVLDVRTGTWRNIFLAQTKNVLTGDVTLNVSGVTVESNIKAVNGTGSLTGDVVMNIADSTVGGTIDATCTGTGTINLIASAGKTLSLTGVSALAVKSFTGGGSLILGKDARLTIGSVSGKTALTVNDLVADTVYITAAGSDTAAFTDAVTTDTYELTGTVNGSNVEWKFTEQSSGGDSGEGDNGGEQPNLPAGVPTSVDVELNVGTYANESMAKGEGWRTGKSSTNPVYITLKNPSGEAMSITPYSIVIVNEAGETVVDRTGDNSAKPSSPTTAAGAVTTWSTGKSLDAIGNGKFTVYAWGTGDDGKIYGKLGFVITIPSDDEGGEGGEQPNLPAGVPASVDAELNVGTYANESMAKGEGWRTGKSSTNPVYITLKNPSGEAMSITPYSIVIVNEAGETVVDRTGDNSAKPSSPTTAAGAVTTWSTGKSLDAIGNGKFTVYAWGTGDDGKIYGKLGFVITIPSDDEGGEGEEGGDDSGSEIPVPKTIFVNTETGNNSNAGTSAGAAKKTVKGAYAALTAVAEAAGVTNDPTAVIDIIVDGTDITSFKGNNTTTGFSGSHVYTVRITGKEPTDGILFGSNFNIPGPTVFDDITLDAANTSDAYFNANAFDLTIGDGVTTTKTGTNYLILTGGKNTSSSFAADRDTTMTVNGGTWRKIYLSPKGSAMVGDVTLNLSGATVEAEIKAVNGTGTMTGHAVLNIKDSTIGGVIDTTCGGTAEVNLTASAGKTLSLTGVSALAVESFTGGGNLVLDRSAALTIDCLTGSTALTVKNPISGQTFITVKNSTSTTAFTDADTTDGYELVATASGSDMLWSYTGGAEAKPIKLTVPSAVTLTVYQGYSDSTPMPTVVVTPGKVSTDAGVTTYEFTTMGAGAYCYITDGEGYYKVLKNFNISESDVTKGKTINADPGKMAGNGYEPTGLVVIRPDEVLEKAFPSTPSTWGAEYEYLFDTPAFDGKHAAHEFTSQEEMMAYVRNLDDADDNLYLYTLGVSPSGNEIPLLLFSKTNLTGKTLEEAAAIIRAEKKPLIHYQAMIHGCEPSPTEGALMVSHALDSAYGNEVLNDVNIYVIPRINVDGAINNSAAQTEGVNMNRDHFHMETDELAYIHAAHLMFEPDVTVDGHEFAQTNIAADEGVLYDILLAPASNKNVPAALDQASWDMAADIMLNRLGKYNLRSGNYAGNYFGDANPTNGRGYYSLYGMLSVILEIPGHSIGGRAGYERRAFAHYAGVTEIIAYVIENAAEVQKIVDDARHELISKGATYEENTAEDCVVLKHKTFSLSNSSKTVTLYTPKYSYATGEISDPNYSKKIGDYVPEIVRTRPTAYVIPKNEPWAAEVAERLALNGIYYYELTAADAVKLQHYSGTADAATLSEEKIFVFDEGAYVFPMNQVGSNIIALRLEPDMVDGSEYNSNILRSGYFVADGGAMPIYRYIHDLVDGKMTLETLPDAPAGLQVVQPATLGAEAKITGLNASKLYEYKAAGEDDYRTVPAGSTEITGLAVGVYSVRYAAAASALASYPVTLEVIDGNIADYIIYVGGANASDINNGLVENKAVATLTQAYIQLAKIMANAPANAEGKIVFLGTVVVEKNGYDTNNDWNNLPAHDYKVTLTGKTGSEGIKSGAIIIFNGDTEISNLTLTAAPGKTRYLSASGYDLVIGEGITSVSDGGTYYGIVGGGKTSTGVVADSTNVVVKSGIWKEIHAGGYTPAVKGDAKLTMTGGTVTGNIYSAYNGDIGGNVTIDLTGVTVNGTVYGGHQYTSTGTTDKVIQGNVAIILGEGTKVDKVYGGGLFRSNVKGTATIIVDGAAQFGVLNGGSNISGKVNGSTVILKSGTIPADFTATVDQVVIDLTGSKTLTLADSLQVKSLVGGGTVSLPAGKVLTVTDSVTGTTTVALTGTIVAGTAAVIAPAATADDAFTSVTELTAVVSGATKVWSTAAAHEHSYTNKNSGALASAATCKAAAKYYVQCDSCDAVSDSVTVIVGNPADHSYGSAWKTDAAKHWHECVYECGTKVDEAAHVPGPAATETAAQTCMVCGYEIAPSTAPAVPDGVPTSADVELNVATYANTAAAKGAGWRTNSGNKDLVYVTLANPSGEAMSITPYNLVIVDASGTTVVNRANVKPGNATTAAGAVTAWSTGVSLDALGSGTFTVYAWGTSGTQTYGKLGFTITIPGGDEPEHTHSFTTKASVQQASAATCTEAAKYYVQCDGCDEVSTDKTVSVGTAAGHTPGTEWKKDANGHWHECTANCGTKLDEAAHVPSAAATATTAQTCAVCEYVIAPALGHTHSFTTKASAQQASAATCTEAAKYYVQCDGCDEVSTDKTVSVGTAAGHTPGTEWKKDANGHWHECTANCGTKLDEAAHVPGAAATATTAQTCTVCGYVIAPATGGSGGGGGGSSSGGGGGGGGSAPTTSTTAEKKPDGTTVTTTTNATTGTVTETTKTADGTTATTVTDKNGVVTEASATVPAAAAKEAAEKGEAVKLPVKVESTSDSKSAVEIEVSVPATGAAVEIPVENVTSGTVVVIVNKDGSEEIVKTSTVTENGVEVTLEESATVKVIDNSKEFGDVHAANHWAEESIDFVVSRELFNGKTEDRFDPNAATTRGQLMTVLARLDDADTTGAPIQKGMEWAVKNGISDGSNAGGNITRQQLAVMLWRYAGQPESDHSVEHHTDDHEISAYAEMAMAWAIENGILTGYADGSLKPHANATRAHVATMVARFVKHLA